MSELYDRVESFCKQIGGKISKGDNYVVCYLDTESEVCLGLNEDDLEISVTRDSEGYGIYSPEKMSLPVNFDIVFELKNAKVSGLVSPRMTKASVRVTACKKVKAFGFLGNVFTWRSR